MTISLSPDEKRQLVARKLRQNAESRPVHRWIEATAKRVPDAAAVRQGERSLTYGELNARANRLARRLRALGVGPETLVGLCVERSPGMVIGLLAVLKAGGAYVPLDPAYPESRLAMMLEDARVSVIVSESGLKGSLPAGEARVVLLDEEDGETEGDEGDLPDGARMENLAYVIYTSGSTGTPKGVAIPHQALTNFLLSMRGKFPLKPGDALLAVTTLSFDIAALELFLPLMQGAVVEIARREEAADARWLIGRLCRSDLTHLQATPATWRMLLDGGWSGSSGLTMLCGGEALPSDLAARLLEKGQALWNLYGPTETTIWSSVARVEAGSGPVPIGRPIANTQFYVLDARLRLAPVGVMGELYIGGAGVARGYLNRSGLTAERFVPDPFSKRPGARLYRTGDLARLRPDGGFECLGRVDHQVKVRGFRIELGEVEEALRRHASVREAVGAVRSGDGGAEELVGYVVPEAGARVESQELRRHLMELLPPQMVPSVFVALERLPLTPNGKVDRKALPSPDPSMMPRKAYRAPRGPIEEAVAQVWEDLMGLGRVGVEENFFEAGGHSLLATRLLARVRDLFEVEVALREFFEEPTVAGLASLVEQGVRERTGTPVPAIRRAERGEAVPASFAQRRLWFLGQLAPESPAYNMPVAVRLEGELDPEAFSRALNEIVRRHEVLRTTFSAPGGVPRQEIAGEMRIELPVLDLSQQPEEGREAEAQRILGEEAARAFDLERGPLIRGLLVRLGDREHLAVVTMHHIVSDGWSLGVLVREASALYEAYAKGEASPLPEPGLQYADFAIWQQEWLQGEVLKEHLDFWVERLQGVPALELPTDRPRPPAPSGRGGERGRDLDFDLLGRLRALARRERATLYMTLMAAYQVLLHRYSGQEDFAVGTPIAGRTRSEVENLVGLFVNTLAVRAEVSGNPSFEDVLRRVRRSALEAYAHQDLPFERVVAELKADRDTARSPVFQALFALQNAPQEEPRSSGLVMTPVEPETGSSKFDLSVFAFESEAGLHLRAQFSADLFDAETIDQMLEHFETLLLGIVARPEQTIGALPMLSDAERAGALGPSDSENLDLDGLSDDEVDALLSRLESAPHGQD